MRTEEYRRKLMTAADAVETVRSGDILFVPGGAMTPVDFVETLPNLIDRRENIRLITYLNSVPLKFFSTEGVERTFSLESAFFGPPLRGLAQEGACSFVPNHLRNLSRDWKYAMPEIDLMVVSVSPMDKHGWFSITSAAVELELLPCCKRVIVEVASHAPRLFGDTMIHISQVDGIIESDRYPALAGRKPPTPEEVQLGGHVAQLVEDGSTVQLGYGATIDALATQLMDKKDLGIHTEVLAECAVDLMEAGVVTNRKKTLHPGLTVTSFSSGSEKFYDYLDDNPGILFKALSYTNNLSVIAQNSKMISINATLQVDLSGQCASESVATRQISGSGGQVDTGVGAQMAGGKSIITLKSTRTLKDSVTGKTYTESSIRPTLPEGACVTYTRTNVHFVATEYGAVCLRGLSVRDRARQLISIAHPDFRDQLREDFERVYRQKL